jgi:retinol dehydrogenase-12
MAWLKALIEFVIKTPFYGAQTTLYCALDEAIECESGMYYSDCAQKTPSARALSKEDQKKLWEISESMVGIKSEK